jgi:hypothetical protein
MNGAIHKTKMTSSMATTVTVGARLADVRSFWNMIGSSGRTATSRPRSVSLFRERRRAASATGPCTWI